MLIKASDKSLPDRPFAPTPPDNFPTSGDWAGSATARSARNAKRLRQHQSPHCDTGSTYRAHRGKRQPALSESVALGGNRTRRVAGRGSESVLAASYHDEFINPVETLTSGQAFVVSSGSKRAI